MKKALIALLIPGIMACATNKQLVRRVSGESPDSVVAGWTTSEVINSVASVLADYHGGIYRWGKERDCDGDGVNEYKWIQGGDGTVFYLKAYNQHGNNVWHKEKKEK